MLLTDPGAPLYNKQTFGKRRYDILWCRSQGHSLPVINGQEQKAGSTYRGKLSVEGLNEPGIKRARIDMTRAYPRGAVQSLVRTLELDSPGNTLTIEDAYVFSKRPASLEEGFVTFEKATVIGKGKAVRLGPARGGAILSAGQPGRFKVEMRVEKPEHTPPDRPPLQRITFVPGKTSKAFNLTFKIHC